MAISQYPAESQESYRRNRNCLPEIAPQGHFLALRAQGATAPTGPRNDKLGGIARSAALPNNRQPARRSLSAATGRLLVPAILMAAGTKRQCLPEIATSACGLLAMTNFWPSRFTGSHYGTTVRHGASRTPLPCNAPVLIPPAWAGEWSGRSRDLSPPASSPPGCPRCGRARGCGSRCSGTAAHPAR